VGDAALGEQSIIRNGDERTRTTLTRQGTLDTPLHIERALLDSVVIAVAVTFCTPALDDGLNRLAVVLRHCD